MTYGPADLARAFRTVRKNTIQIAQDIPEDKYDFVPAPGTRSVRQLLGHIAFAPMLQEDMHRVKRITSFLDYDFFAANKQSTEEADKPRTKAQLIDVLTRNGESFATWLESLTPEFLGEVITANPGQPGRSRFDSLMSVKEHEMHHRGQLMLMERLIGVVPHLTRQREEMNRQRAAAAAAKA